MCPCYVISLSIFRGESYVIPGRCGSPSSRLWNWDSSPWLQSFDYSTSLPVWMFFRISYFLKKTSSKKILTWSHVNFEFPPHNGSNGTERLHLLHPLCRNQYLLVVAEFWQAATVVCVWNKPHPWSMSRFQVTGRPTCKYTQLSIWFSVYTLFIIDPH